MLHFPHWSLGTGDCVSCSSLFPHLVTGLLNREGQSESGVATLCSPCLRDLGQSCELPALSFSLHRMISSHLSPEFSATPLVWDPISLFPSSSIVLRFWFGLTICTKRTLPMQICNPNLMNRCFRLTQHPEKNF